MKLLFLAGLLGVGTMFTPKAYAEEQMAAPQCQTAQDEDGALTACNNLSENQSLAMMQSPDAARRCYRVCQVRIGLLCLGYHVECRHYRNFPGRGWYWRWENGHRVRRWH